MDKIDMLRFLKNHTYPIGVDMGDDTLKLTQFASDEKGISLIAGGSINRPPDVKPNSADWQRWAIESIKSLTSGDKFRGREVVVAMPTSELFIDHMKLPKVTDSKLEEALFSKIRQKLLFEPDDLVIKWIPTEDNNAVVIATEREKVYRYLAIYESANLHISSISAWPIGMAKSYTSFFCKHDNDIEAIVMLLDIEANYTNVVICDHEKLFFTSSISIGTEQFHTNEMVTRLALELTVCRDCCSSIYKNAQVERLIFFSGSAVDKDLCTKIAKLLKTPAQMADCLAAVRIEDSCLLGTDGGGCEFSWATAFGLSLS